MTILDVTKLEPRLKHPTIFNKYDELEGGEAFVIHNDHDPKPLYYQMLAERGQTFEWEYLEEGPEWWKVKIAKLKLENPKTVGELVAEDFRKAEVFRKFGIDFCCGGRKSLKEACTESGVSAEIVEGAISEIEGQTKNYNQNFNRWELDFLSDYIVNTHHSYVSESLPMLDELTSKVARVHGANHPELLEIRQLYVELAEELYAHMGKEEQILFPYVKKLVAAKKSGQRPKAESFGNAENPIAEMESEHEFAGNHVKTMRALSNDFTPPMEACTSYRVLFSKLAEFEQDLHEHIHLENNILFPKVKLMEKELLN